MGISHNIHLRRIDTLVHERQLLKTGKNYSPFLYEYNLLFSTISLETELGYLLKNAADPNSISFFTDSSKDEVCGTVGAACYLPDLNTFSLLGLNRFFSIFSAECIAIKNAIKMALESSHDNVFIYSDSLSALQALIKSSVTINTNPFILDIRRLINRFTSSNKKLYVYWVPSHIGITFNEKAHSVVKEASCTNVSPDILVPFSDFSHSFKKPAKTETERQNISESEFKSKKSFKSYYHSSAKPWFSRR